MALLVEPAVYKRLRKAWMMFLQQLASSLKVQSTYLTMSSLILRSRVALRRSLSQSICLSDSRLDHSTQQNTSKSTCNCRWNPLLVNYSLLTSFFRRLTIESENTLEMTAAMKVMTQRNSLQSQSFRVATEWWRQRALIRVLRQALIVNQPIITSVSQNNHQISYRIQHIAADYLVVSLRSRGNIA